MMPKTRTAAAAHERRRTCESCPDDDLSLIPAEDNPRPVDRTPTIDDGELERLVGWWEAANYLTVAQIYLQDNPLLRELLRRSTSSRGCSATGVPRRVSTSSTPTFSSWVAGDTGEAPGRALAPGEQAPDYFHNRDFEGLARVIAHADGYKLYAILQPDGSVEFDLGNTGVGLGFDPASFDDHGLFVLARAQWRTPTRTATCRCSGSPHAR
jgi:hypothetical protein